MKVRLFGLAALVAASCSAKPHSEAHRMSDLESELRKQLGHSGSKGPLDAAPVESVLAWLARQPAGAPKIYTDAVSVATALAQAAANNDILRTNATRLVGRLYPLSEPITPANVAFDPNATQETIQGYKNAREAYRKQGRDTLLPLARDPVATVAAAAAIELLSNATTDERRSLRPGLQAVAPTLRANVNIPEVATALLQLGGTQQAIAWLNDYAAHRPIPMKVEDVAQQVKLEPNADALTALESALVADKKFQDPSFEPKPSSLANSLRLPVYDADTERLQQMLAAVFAVDPNRAEAIAERAPPKLSARLRAFLSTRAKGT